MVFSSLTFLFLYLPLTLLVYFLSPLKWRNFVLLLVSLLFYGWGEPVYIVIMFVSIIIDYTHGLLVEKHRSDDKKARWFVAQSVIFNLALLFFFKYGTFFAENLYALTGILIPQSVKLLGVTIPLWGVPLPIGISFYTFQAVSYLIDVYWDDCEASHNFVNFACYISLFPQLIAGPIVRYRDVNEQLVSRHETPTLFNSGVRLFMVGMAKKVLLANQFGMLWESVSADPVAAGAIGAWVGACAYTLQIYFDFAGYSDMARGLGRMLGFEFCINFNYPYISKSVTEFWRRWHISLSTWFRDYVYIPLGGNRCGKIRQCVNILVVWALTGFWHGAGWNFLFWGFYYGILLLIEKLVLGKYIRRLPAPVQHLYTMVIVVIGWVFFASPDLSTALDYLQVMFSFTPGTVGTASLVMPWLGMGILGVLASTPLAKTLWEKVQDKKWMPLAEGALCLAGLLLCTASLVSDSYNPFLYFRF